METSRKRIRRDYAPLTLAVSVVCTTPSSPTTQVYNAFLSEFEPDREPSPCVLQPVVTAKAQDGSWENPNVNGQIGEMKWLVNGKDITTLSEWAGKYTINNGSGYDRGAITIKKNVMPKDVYSLQFRGVVADDRTGMNINFSTDVVTLSTTDKSEDDFTINVGKGGIIRYNPMLDKYLLYEHKVAHGMIRPSETAEAAAKDGNEYLCKIPLKVFRGRELMTRDYVIKIYRVADNGAMTECAPSATNADVVSVTNTQITLDMRMIEKNEYAVKVFYKDKEKAKAQFSVSRIYPRFRCSPTNGTSIGAHDTQRYDKAMADSNGQILECPALLLKIVWKTDTAAIKGVIHNEGDETLFSLEKTGVGKTYRDDWIDVYTEADHKPVYNVATDSNGNAFTDENNNILIFN